MPTKGKIRSWNDQKGFGFITSSDGGKDVFIHISAFGNRNRRPEIGQYLTYTLSSDKQGRPLAIKATLPGDQLAHPGGNPGLAWAVIVAGALIAQQALRHKSKKQSFRIAFWMTVFVNCSVFVWLLTPDGSGTVQSWIGEGYGISNSRQTGTIKWAE